MYSIFKEWKEKNGKEKEKRMCQKTYWRGREKEIKFFHYQVSRIEKNDVCSLHFFYRY